MFGVPTLTAYVKLLNFCYVVSTAASVEEKQGKRDYEASLLEISDSQPKRFHVYINRRRRAQPVISEVIAADGQRMLSDEEKVQALASQYRGVYATQQQIITLVFLPSQSPVILTNIAFSVENVIRI
ncbi:unnamed protein product [Dibothriocephalus latus]|uniref:Uncharacterized protein n=1 Tax=Dibothriocephalus latus TaxID=60516 RepID=A0A3P6TEE5_DIBLA|nr:unnamed protein product [Dibothriocephalus latus]